MSNTKQTLKNNFKVCIHLCGYCYRHIPGKCIFNYFLFVIYMYTDIVYKGKVLLRIARDACNSLVKVVLSKAFPCIVLCVHSTHPTIGRKGILATCTHLVRNMAYPLHGWYIIIHIYTCVVVLLNVLCIVPFLCMQIILPMRRSITQNVIDDYYVYSGNVNKPLTVNYKSHFPYVSLLYFYRNAACPHIDNVNFTLR